MIVVSLVKEAAIADETSSLLTKPIQDTVSCQQAWNVITLMLNLGMLAMPLVCAKLTWLAVCVIVLTGLVACHTGILVGGSLYSVWTTHLTRRPDGQVLVRRQNSLGGIVHDVWPEFGEKCTRILLVGLYAGTQTLYHVLLGDCVHGLIEERFAWGLTRFQWMAIASYTLIVPFLFVKSSRFICHLASFAWFACLVALFIVLTFSFDKLSVQGQFTWPSSLADRVEWAFVPLAMNIVLFSLSFHSALPGLEVAISSPGLYRTTLVFAFSLIMLLQLTIGITIGLVFPQGMQSILRHPPALLSTSVRLLVGAMCVFSIPRCVFLLDSCLKDGPWFVARRLLLFHVGFVASFLVDNFCLSMATLGSLASPFLVLICPALLNLRLFSDRMNLLTRFQLRSLVALGLILIICGLMSSIRYLFPFGRHLQ